MHTSILLPSKFIVVQEEGTTGVYDIEGLHPGYGYTLGNSLRRVILSSLEGSAVTLIKIEGAEHEYSTLPGVKEDVLAILLNLKQVRFRSLTDEAQIVALAYKGQGSVTAKDLQGNGTVEILNPDQHIAEITDAKGSLSMELTIERGVGFVPREMIHREKLPIGTMGVDAIYTPVRKVHYEVENMRVGDRTDYHRLRISIETDGTISPREALEESIRAMMRQFGAILDLAEDDIFPSFPLRSFETGESSLDMGTESSSLDTEKSSMKASVEVDDAFSDILKTRIETLELSTRTANALSDASIRTIGGLVKKTEEDLLDLDGLGAKGIEEIKSALAKLGTSLRK